MWRLLSLFMLVFSLSCQASTPEDKEFKKWLNQHKQEFKRFVDQHDQEFADFLKSNWVELDVKPEEQRDSTPKPVDIPVAAPEPEPAPTLPPVIKPLPVPVTPPSPPGPPKVDDFDFSQGQASIKVGFLGHTLTMPKLELPSLAQGKASFDQMSSDKISEAWLTMAKTHFKAPVAALTQAAKAMMLDDWGQALLTHNYLASTRRLNSAESQLYAWFYLVKQGYDARIAYHEDKVYLMLSVEQTLFGQKYFALKSGKYYFVDLAKKRPVEVGSVYTYDKQHASASDKINIDLSVAPLQASANKIRQLSTKFNNREIAIEAPYSLDYIEFLDHYPQLSMDYYFKAELPEVTRQALVSQLRPYIEGLSEQQALNLLLHFVQKSLLYQTDQQQFNFENYLFAGETLHYPYADCEDRAVLYAYLVKHLLGNQVIGLQYDGHIATAVAVSSDIPGDKFKYKGKTFVVADPTFINANLGRTMTGFEKQSPELIVY